MYYTHFLNCVDICQKQDTDIYMKTYSTSKFFELGSLQVGYFVILHLWSITYKTANSITVVTMDSGFLTFDKQF